MVSVSPQVAESFNTGDPFSQQAPVQMPHSEQKVMLLQKPPKWIRKPVGASFAVSQLLGFFGKCSKLSAGVSISSMTIQSLVYAYIKQVGRYKVLCG